MPQTADFHDVRFPVRVAFGATGGPERRTEITTLQSGLERRNARQVHGRRRFDAASGVQVLADIEAIAAFFEARRGELFSFRYRDPFDWKSCTVKNVPAATDQPLGIGDGIATVFQLTKTYGTGPGAYMRPIRLPVAGTVKAAVDGNAIATGFSVDPMAGTIAFDVAPATGAVLTAGYEYDIKARFATPALTLSMAAFQAGQIPTIPIVEVL
jgi:uncharacterized protein (TIGR02217 family)